MTQEIITITVEAGQMTARRKSRKIDQRRPVPVWAIKEIANLLQAMRRGEVNRLVIGPKAYGTNKWVITKLSNSLKRFDRWGNLLVASVNVTMQSYAVR